MLIESYGLDVFTPPCEPGAERYSAIARLSVDISEVLPYLNATLNDALYDPHAEALTWRRGGRKIVFTARQIAVSNLEDREQAVHELEAEIERVNRTWARRADITPSTRARQRMVPLTVYRLLPQTNCQQCGEPTCYVFAGKLAASQQTLDACTALQSPEWHDQLATLRELVAGAAS